MCMCECVMCMSECVCGMCRCGVYVCGMCVCMCVSAVVTTGTQYEFHRQSRCICSAASVAGNHSVHSKHTV